MAVDHPAHHSEFRRWSGGVDRRICQTFAASPAEPGELPLGFRTPVDPTAAGCSQGALTDVNTERPAPSFWTARLNGNRPISGDPQDQAAARSRHAIVPSLGGMLSFLH